MYNQYRKILTFFILASTLYSQDCTTTNPFQYGACETSLGFVWDGYNLDKQLTRVIEVY